MLLMAVSGCGWVDMGCVCVCVCVLVCACVCACAYMCYSEQGSLRLSAQKYRIVLVTV